MSSVYDNPTQITPVNLKQFVYIIIPKQQQGLSLYKWLSRYQPPFLRLVIFAGQGFHIQTAVGLK